MAFIDSNSFSGLTQSFTSGLQGYSTDFLGQFFSLSLSEWQIVFVLIAVILLVWKAQSLGKIAIIIAVILLLLIFLGVWNL